jgi:hypothetical protein
VKAARRPAEPRRHRLEEARLARLEPAVAVELGAGELAVQNALALDRALAGDRDARGHDGARFAVGSA